MQLKLSRAVSCAALTGLLSLGVVFAQNTPSSADKKFMTDAAQGGLAEVQLGQLATQKATNPDVKAFGQRMVDDHTKANDQLKSIASQQNVTLPSSMDAKDQALYDRLSGMSGSEFDKVYMQHMVMDHKKDIAEFRKEANGGKDSAIKQFASSTLPTLEEHLKMAQDAHAKVGSAMSTADRKK